MSGTTFQNLDDARVSATLAAPLPGLVGSTVVTPQIPRSRLRPRFDSSAAIGMPAEVITNLFAKFAQADSSTTRRFGGTGLGLAICKHLAELMGGSIEVLSEEGRGSQFTFRIPAVRVGEPRELVTSDTATPGAGPILGIRVLAAEDNSINRLVLKTLLYQIGVEPTFVENGQLALEAWEAQAWDAILMDVQMPVMDGVAATRAIRDREAVSGRCHTPIIALTANAMTHQIAEYRSCGMDGHIVKPIEAAKLFKALETALGEASGDSSVRAA